MNTTITTFALIATLILLSACDQTDATPAPVSNLTTYNGIWDVSGKTAAGPDKDENCGYGLGNGVLNISGITVAGRIEDDSGYEYKLEGKIDDSGKMEGAFTYEGYDAATFAGALTTAEGAGGFKDINGCPGTWQVKKRIVEEAKPEKPKQS